VVKVLFIINRKRKLQQHALDLLNLAEKSPMLQVEKRFTDYAGHATEIAQLNAKIHDVLVAIGGDGTAHEVLNGICKSGNKSISFGIIPNGTGNDFARMLKPFNSADFLKQLEQKRSQKIDIGEVKQKTKTDYFLNIADIGFGAKVVDVMHRQRLMGIQGKFSYTLSILRTFFIFKKTNLIIEGENFKYQGKPLMVAFCNGSAFGHGLVIHPEAKINNGYLGITVIGNVSILTYLKKLKDLKNGKKIKHSEVNYFNTRSVLIKRSNNNVLVEGDGELLGNSLIRVSILKAHLNLINSVLD